MPVLGTKLHVPRPRRELVARPRLTDRLPTDGTLAPTGPGRRAGRVRQDDTADPVARRRGPRRRVAWLSLDAERQRPAPVPRPPRRRGPAGATDTWTRRRGAALLETDGGVPADDVLVSLVNDLDAAARPDRARLDDYHVIDAPGRPRSGDLPARQPPPPGHPRHHDPGRPAAAAGAPAGPWRAVELRAADLRFTTDEADAFLNQVMGLGLEPAHVAALEAPDRGLGRRAPAGRAVGARAPDAEGGVAPSSRRSPAATASSSTTWWRRYCDGQPDGRAEFLLDTSVLRRAERRRCVTR